MAKDFAQSGFSDEEVRGRLGACADCTSNIGVKVTRVIDIPCNPGMKARVQCESLGNQMVSPMIAVKYASECLRIVHVSKKKERSLERFKRAQEMPACGANLCHQKPSVSTSDRTEVEMSS